MSGPAFPGLGSPSTKTRVFLSYDMEHDRDLRDLFVETALAPAASYEMSSESARRSASDLADTVLHREIRAADVVIVLCGQYTDASGRVAAEVRVAQEEARPYFLLWGRREPMCTRPSTAKATDTMFSWTPEIVRDQIRLIRRVAESNARVAARNARSR